MKKISLVRLRSAVKAPVPLAATAMTFLGLTAAFGGGPPLKPLAETATNAPLVVPPAGTPANQGYKLFLMNCAHCHGTDARGDEGPDLHGVTKSDRRITNLIQNGVKGEMPRFGSKLNDADTQALIAFIRTLKDE